MPELRSDWANNQLLLLAAIKDFKDKLASGEYSANQRFHVSLDFKCEFSTLRERDDYIAALGKLKQFNFTDELGRPDPLPKVDITFTADDPVDPAVGRFYLASSRFPIDPVVANFDPATIPFTSSFMLRLFLSSTDRKVIPGDLEEEFRTEILPNYGARRARYWYLVQVIRTIVYRNQLVRWLLVSGTLYKVGEWIMRKIGG